MKANQLIAGTVIVAGLILGAAAQAQGLGGLGGHVGGALGGGAGGGMAGFNGMGGMNGAINRNSLGANADGFGSASRKHSQDVSTDTAAAAKSHTARSPENEKTGKLGDATPAAQGAAQQSSHVGIKRAVATEDSSAEGGARALGTSAPTASTEAPQSAPPPSTSRGATQSAVGANASKSGVDADASGQGTVTRGGSRANGGASMDSSVGR